jgi:hypothetical protein
MTPRIVASGCVAVIGFGLMLAPVEASARGGGFGAPRGLIGPGAFHPTIAKPSGIHPFHAKRFYHRGPFRYGAPLLWGTPYWYPVDTSPLYAAPYDQFVDDQPPFSAAGPGPTPRHISVVARPRVCNTQIVTVPSESGGQRAITVTRC